MKKFLIKFTFFIVIPLISIGYITQYFIDRSLINSNFGNYKEWNDILKSKINADIIIQGSSRAWVHISPKVLDSVFLCNSYNLGLDGYDFLMQYYRFKLYIKYNKKPKYIIQNVDHFTLTKREDLYQLEQFIPYLDNNLIQAAVKNYKGFDYKDFYIPCLKYSHTTYTKDLIYNSLNPNALQTNKYKGFEAQSKNWDLSFEDFCQKNLKGYRLSINKTVQTSFIEFLKFCKKENIKIIFVYTPEYYKAQKLLLNRDSITNLFEEYSKTYNIPFLDYSNDSICQDTINFYNSQHLNSNGVIKFNLKFSNDLKKIIK